MKLGFTGTRRGMTLAQKSVLYKLLLYFRENYKANEFHHGDCIGADAEAHNIAKSLDYEIIVHPPIDSKLRAFKQGDKILPAKPYLTRNRDIVDSIDVLIATPRQAKEILRSGTWATVRYARRVGKAIIIVYPDGNINCERIKLLKLVR